MGKARTAMHRKVRPVAALIASAVLLFANPFAVRSAQAASAIAATAATPAPATYTYEDASLRLSVTVADSSLLPQGTRIEASAETPEPGIYDAALSANEFDPSLATATIVVRFAFTLSNTPLDTQSIPVTCKALLKNVDSTGLTAVVLTDGSAALATELTQTAEGAQVSFSAEGATDFGIALLTNAAQASATPTATAATTSTATPTTTATQTAAPAATPQPVAYTYEDDVIRITATSPDASLVPSDAKLAASASTGDWAEYAEALLGQGYHEGRLLYLEKVLAAFAWNNALVDTSGFPIAYDVLLKNVRFTDATALVLHSGVALTPDSYVQTADGTRVTFSATGAVAFAIALVTATPTPATFTYANKTARLNVTVADDTLLPMGTELTASLSEKKWRAAQDALTGLGVSKEQLQQLWQANVSFARDGESVEPADIPIAYELLLPSALVQGTRVWIIGDDGSTAPAEATSTADGGTAVAFTLSGATSFFIALANASQSDVPVSYTYEDDSIRLTIDVADADLLPTGAQFIASATNADWDAYADILRAQGFSEARVRKIVKIKAGFSLNGKTIDAAGVPMRYTLLLKNAQKGDSAAWVLYSDTVAQADEYLQTENGAQAAFSAIGEEEIALAVINYTPLYYVYEDDAFRLTVSLPDETLLPLDADMSANISQGNWQDAARRLEAQGFDESRVQRLLNISVSFTDGDTPVDLRDVPIRFRLLIKGAEYAGMQAWALRNADAALADTLESTPEGAEIVFTVTGETDVGLAVALPGRTAYACTIGNLYAVAVLSDPGALPQEAELTVEPLLVTEEIQAAVEALGMSAAAQSPAALGMGLKVLASYVFHFVVGDQEYTPQTGTARITLAYDHPLAATSSVADVQVARLAEADGALKAVQVPSSTVAGSGQAIASVAFDADSFPNYLLTEPMRMDASLCYTAVATQEQTYTHTPYYNGGGALGVANGFHLVGFGEVHLNARVHGNILADTLFAQASFGTDDATNDVSYIRNYAQVSAQSAVEANGALALGSGVAVSLGNGGRSFAVNGTLLSAPTTILQDADTAALAFVDLAAARAQAQSVSATLANLADSGIDAQLADSDRRTLTLTSPAAVGVYRFDAQTVNDLSQRTLYLEGFTSAGDGCMVLNVDCSGAQSVTLPPIRLIVDGTETQVIGQADAEPCRVLWNLFNCDGVTIVTNTLPCAVLALGATVQVNEALGGTVIAQNIEVNAETYHRALSNSLAAIIGAGTE